MRGRSREEELKAYRKATENAIQLEMDSEGTLRLLGGWTLKEIEYSQRLYRTEWVWYKFFFYDKLTGKQVEILIPGCDMECIRPEKEAGIEERVRYTEIVIDGGNQFWPFYNAVSAEDKLTNRIEEKENEIRECKEQLKRVKEGKMP